MGKSSRCAWSCLLLFLMALGGCREPSHRPEIIYGEARVDSIEMSIIEEFPARVTVIVKGDLGDDCTKIESIRQEVNGFLYVITITVERPVDKSCAQREALFTATVPLSVENLTPGMYTVTANGVSTTFQWVGSEGPPLR